MAAACLGIDLFADTKFEVFGHADAHFLKIIALAGNGYAIGPHAGIGRNKGFFDQHGINAPRSCNIAKARRNIHFVIGLTNRCEIFVLCKPGTASMLSPLMGDQTRRGHNIENARNNLAGHKTAATPTIVKLAIGRIAKLVLRPEAMHDEAEGPRCSALLLIGSWAFKGTIAWRP